MVEDSLTFHAYSKAILKFRVHAYSIRTFSKSQKPMTSKLGTGFIVFISSLYKGVS